MAVPLFAPDEKPLVGPERTTRFLKVGGFSIPVCEEEFQMLSQKVREHIDQHGVLYGFIAQLLIPSVLPQLSSSATDCGAVQPALNQ